MDYYKTAYKYISESPPNPQKALRYLEKAHTGGNPEATYALGTWYLFGHHVEKNLKKAVALLQRSLNTMYLMPFLIWRFVMKRAKA